MINIFKISKKNILFLIFLLVLVVVTTSVFKKSYSSFESETIINLEVQTALYIFEEEEINFNAQIEQLVPSDDPYIYTFSISNFKDNTTSDVDIEYTVSILTTTNLPLTYELYRNEEYSTGTNIITSTNEVIDLDGSWYKNIVIDSNFEMYYTSETTDIYYLVVDFPKTYADTIAYQGLIDSIEVNIKSKQIVG